MNRNQRRSQERDHNRKKPTSIIGTYEDIINSDINYQEFGVVVLDISQDMLKYSDVFFKNLPKFLIKDNIGKLMISFNGYDSDPREIWEISETKNFLNEIVDRNPEILFYFSFDTFLLFLATKFIIKDTNEFDSYLLISFLNEYKNTLNIKSFDNFQHNICVDIFLKLVNKFELSEEKSK